MMRRHTYAASLLCAASLLAGVPAAQAEYVAFAVDSKNNERALPENIDTIEAKELVHVKWGAYTGNKTRVAVLKVDNKSKTGSMTISGPGGQVVEFNRDTAGVPVDGIEAILTDALHQSGRFRVVERTVLDQQLKEQDLGASGRVAQPSAAKIGNVLGAQFQIQAVVTSYEPNYEGKNMGLGGIVGGAAGALLGGVGMKSKKSMVAMNFRLVDATTSEVVFTKQVESVMSESGLTFGGLGIGGGGALGGFMSSYAKTPVGQAVIAAVNKGVYELIKQVGSAPPTGSVMKIAGSKVYVNMGEGSVKAGDEVKVYSVGEALIDPDTGVSLGAEEEEIGTLKVTDVKEKFSIADAVGFPASKLKTGDKVKSTVTAAQLEFGPSWDEKK